MSLFEQGAPTNPFEVRTAATVAAGELPRRTRLLVGVAVVALLGASAALVHALGGTQHAWPHLLYLPILVAAWAFGPIGGLAAGVVAGLLLGPAMPLDVAEGTAQATANWLYRLGFFALVGGVGGMLHREVRAQLAQSDTLHQRFASLVDNAPDLIVACGPSGKVGYVSPSLTPMLGHDVVTLVGARFADFVHPEDRPALLATMGGGAAMTARRLELRAHHADGSWRHLEVTVSNLLAEPAVCAVVLNARDVTERHTMEAELRHHLWHDPSTGLVNRSAFTDAVAEVVAGGGDTDVAVMVITLDRFQAVQETLDPDTGSQLVNAMAKRLASHTRPSDLLASYATTEFAVLCPGVGGHDAASQIADRLLRAAEEPFLLIAGEVRLGVSIGVALASDAEGSAAQLMRDAHAAARHASQSGGNQVAIFEIGWRDQAATAMHTESALHSALRRDEFTLHYQPIIDLPTGAILGAEALIRWNHPRLGMVPPSDFIPIAEQCNMIGPIGRWVLEEAIGELARWRAETGRDDLVIAVNVSARQLDDPGLVDHVWAVLSACSLPGNAVTLELTETALLEDSDRTNNMLAAIRDLGVQIAVDDFGTGYSSLSYLQELPIDVLKIDRSFIARLDRSSADDAIVSAVIGLARSFDLDIIAEGVEEQVQAERLAELGCTTAQGYLYGRPQAPGELLALLGAEPSQGFAHRRLPRRSADIRPAT